MVGHLLLFYRTCVCVRNVAPLIALSGCGAVFKIMLVFASHRRVSTMHVWRREVWALISVG